MATFQHEETALRLHMQDAYNLLQHDPLNIAAQEAYGELSA
jgi:hypothetical protein